MASGTLKVEFGADFLRRFMPELPCDVCGGRTLFSTCVCCSAWAAEQIARELLRTFSGEQVATFLALRILYSGRPKGGA